SGRSRPAGSNRRLRTFETSRSHVLVLAPMKLSSRSFARFSDFDLLKSHVAKAAYVSSIIGPLITVKDETTAALVVVITLRAGRRELQESVAHRGRSRGRAE